MKILRPIEDIVALLGWFLVGIGIYIAITFLAGCATKSPTRPIEIPKEPEESACVTNPPNVSVTVLEGSKQLTCQELQHIVMRTNQFCKNKGRSPVKKLVVFKKIVDRSSAMQVVYRCSWGENEFRIFYL